MLDLLRDNFIGISWAKKRKSKNFENMLGLPPLKGFSMSFICILNVIQVKELPGGKIQLKTEIIVAIRV